jgi:DNA-binding transcriptional MerR regulator
VPPDTAPPADPPVPVRPPPADVADVADPADGAEPAEPPGGGVEPPASDRLRFRADELAAAAGISVQALRAYQSKGLVPPPRHEGRVAWYGQHHRERLDRIRDLKERGYSLRMIAEALDEGAARPAGLVDDHAVLRLADVAERSGVPVEVLRALAASGLLRPHEVGGVYLYSEADVRFVRNVLALLGVGLSLDDFLRIAHPLMVATGALGRDAVAEWRELVGTRIRQSRDDATAEADGDAAAATRVAESLRDLAAIVGQLVAYHVERAVLDAARADLDARGTVAERAALVRTLTAPA